MKKVVWMLVSCLMVVSLVMASCGPATEEEVEIGEAEVIIEGEEEEEEVEEEVVEEEGLLPPEVPKYGGSFAFTFMGNSAFDPFINNRVVCGSVYHTNEGLIDGDWSRGPAGTGENEFFDGFGGQIKFMKGWLAESWETPDGQTIVFNIRKGVHWWDKPPVNGREVTAQDVVWTLDRYYNSPRSYIYANFGRSGITPTSILALDKYTVEVKLPPGVQGLFLIGVGATGGIFPPEPTEVYGDMQDWRHAIGTSPWMLTDFVPDVSVTYTRNPNYWQFDPIHPENRLPYPDEMKTLTIPDLSTQMAAFRTGKLDLIQTEWENFEQLIEENPELQYSKMQTFGNALSGRVDKPELPFDDLRVRQALNMAVNKQELIDDYYEGNAVMLGYPIKIHKAWEGMYIPLEEQPESVQELFTYNPEKARQLLAEAGYPDGFKTKVATRSTAVDFLSIIREYLLDVGVDMEIDVMEGGTFSSVWVGRTHEEMIYAAQKPEHPYMLYCERPDQFWDSSYWSHPRVDEAFTAIGQNLGVDDAEIIRIMRDIGPFILENAWAVWLPIPYVYRIWWPWYQGYRGEFDIGYNSQGRDKTYIWIDEALKKSMGY